jgi:hypothetical protein
MVPLPEGSHPDQRDIQRHGCVIIFFMILGLSGCMHQGDPRDQGRDEHEAALSSHRNLDIDVPRHYSPGMEEALNMTDLQKFAFNRNKVDYRKLLREKTEEIRKAEIALADLLAKEMHDRQAIQEHVKTIGDLKEELIMVGVDSLLTLKALFTENQYDQFRKILRQPMKHDEG